MKKAPKVLTRMRLSCCWGDNLNEKELNDVVDYINGRTNGYIFIGEGNKNRGEKVTTKTIRTIIKKYI